ncbi:MAG: hypothetical protein KDK39_11885 [Leptospiraceae bacterium]|nr:hypothetical protein [Leptospiraceae bacterium]
MQQMSRPIAALVILILINITTGPAHLLAQEVQEQRISDQEQYERMQTRRSMLEWHQITGLLTWGLWLATNLEGERIAKTHQRVGEQEMQLLWLSNPDAYTPLYLLYRENAEWKTTADSSTHKSLAAATAGMYALTAVLALCAPPLYDEQGSDLWDSSWWHRALAFVHLAAMLSLPALGHQAEEGPDGLQKMRNVGWAGFGVYSVAIGVFYF